MAKEIKKKVGRPLTQLSDLPKNWKKIIKDEMSEGASRIEVMAKLKIRNDLFYSLIKREPDFSEAIKEGVGLCEAWWKTKGRKNLENKNFSAVLWYMNMKNRFGWRDKTETDITSGGEKIKGFDYIMPKEDETNNKTIPKTTQSLSETSEQSN